MIAQFLCSHFNKWLWMQTFIILWHNIFFQGKSCSLPFEVYLFYKKNTIPMHQDAHLIVSFPAVTSVDHVCWSLMRWWDESEERWSDTPDKVYVRIIWPGGWILLHLLSKRGFHYTQGNIYGYFTISITKKFPYLVHWRDKSRPNHYLIDYYLSL